MPSIHPLPSWAATPRPHQPPAIESAVEAFNAGTEVVFMDAPTGSGKTYIGELVRRELDVSALYVCTDKQLQAQFLRAFPYAKLLMGKANYKPHYGGEDITCEDCTANGPDDTCMWCPDWFTCPYQVAKKQALNAEVAVLNTSYFLTEANFVGKFSKQDLIIIDEGDTLEDMLMGFVEYSVPEYIMRDLRLQPPIKGARKPTIMLWLNTVADKARAWVSEHPNMEEKRKRRWAAFVEDTWRVRGELQRDIDAAARKKANAQLDDGTDDEAEDSGRWLRDYDTKTFALKPVLVSTYGPKNLWRHSRRFLVMSATIVSADEMVDSLGIPFDWETVVVPMTFPVENRPIILAPVADVTYKNMDEAVPQLVYAIARICENHPGERVLVHAVSKKLNKELTAGLRAEGVGPLFTYEYARERTEVVERFTRAAGGVLISHSMDRGVDLEGDACSVVIVAKVPSPALGDKRVSARMHLPGGEQWYAVQAVRKIVQMTGRHVRSAEDKGVTYILDAQFTKNLYRRNQGLFPGWWREAIDQSFDVRDLMPRRVRR
jgi:Rad3-related DNA helicase